jgi:CRP-like cAMP-binding protein
MAEAGTATVRRIRNINDPRSPLTRCIMKKYYLALEKGSLRTSMHPLLGPTTIGRGLDNAIIIQEPTASRFHACVSLQDGTWTVEDLGSTNGVLVAGKRIKKVPLTTGDTFQIGDFTFRLVETELSGDRTQFSQTVQILSASINTAGADRAAAATSPSPERLKDAIAAIPFFKSLNEKEYDRLVSTSTLHIFQPGETIIRQGDPGRSVFLILHGRVRVFTRDYKGEELALAELGVSQFFGEISFLTGQPRSSYVEPLENSVLVELSYTAMYKLAQENPQVKKTLAEYYQERVNSTKKTREKAGAPERRRHERLNERLPVTFMVVSQSEGPEAETTKIFTGSSLDISMSGAVLECKESGLANLNPDVQVRLEIQLPPPWERVRAVGSVRRFQAASAETKAAIIALEFKAMPGEDIRKLKGFLHGERPPEAKP